MRSAACRLDGIVITDHAHEIAHFVASSPRAPRYGRALRAVVTDGSALCVFGLRWQTCSLQVNLVPQTARAWVNHRIHPADGSDLEKATRTLSHAQHADARSRAHDTLPPPLCTHAHSLTRRSALSAGARVRPAGDRRRARQARGARLRRLDPRRRRRRGAAMAAARTGRPPVTLDRLRSRASASSLAAIYSLGVGRSAAPTRRAAAALCHAPC